MVKLFSFMKNWKNVFQNSCSFATFLGKKKLFLPWGYKLGSFKCYGHMSNLECFLISSLFSLLIENSDQKEEASHYICSFVSSGITVDVACWRGRKVRSLPFCWLFPNLLLPSYHWYSTVMFYFRLMLMWTCFHPWAIEVEHRGQANNPSSLQIWIAKSFHHSRLLKYGRDGHF